MLRNVENRRDWPYSEREDAMLRFMDDLRTPTRRDELARILTSETGKPITQARNEITSVVDRVAFFINETSKVMAKQTVRSDSEMVEEITWEPLGVIANISAWNYPYFVGLNVIAPALLTGNGVLYKPSELATNSGLAIVQALHRAGVPQDWLVSMVGGAEIGAEIARLPIDGLFFTGSYATGQKLLAATAGRMVKLQLELGGKDPAYVCGDADLPAAAATVADGTFYNAGQSCCAVERIYVEEGAHDDFLELFLREVDRLKVGDPLKDDTDVGPLARAAQIEILEEQIRDALGKGAKLLRGGQRMPGPGNYFEPTVLDSCTNDMRIMREESFGPIIGIQSVMNDDDAIIRMNDTDYGLTASVHTADETRARNILARVDTATAYWNCCDRVSPRLPWSGRKHSGTGVTLSRYGIETFLRPRAWHLKRS